MEIGNLYSWLFPISRNFIFVGGNFIEIVFDVKSFAMGYSYKLQ